MATSVQPAENTIHGFTIGTHVVPAGTEAGASTTGQVGKLLKGDPKALGVVQIMIGITTFMLGIVSAVFFFSPSSQIGVTFWGAVLHMVSGGLSVGASKKAHGCVVKCSLVMNVFSAVAAGLAIIILAIDIAREKPCYRYDDQFRYMYSSRPKKDLCGLLYGIAGIQLVLAVLEFIISICTFACEVTCCKDPTDLKMATSVQPAENTIHGFTIVTHVVPAGTEAGASTTGQVGKLLKGDPKALGVVQIMIGITTFILGIVSAMFFYSASTKTGVTFWGAVLYMVSGGLSVGASKKAHGCVVKGSLVMNVFSAVAAGLAIIVLASDIATADPCYRYYYYHDSSHPNVDLCGLSYGIFGIQLGLAVLEFIISICTSAFACEVTCCRDLVQVVFAPAHPVTAA